MQNYTENFYKFIENNALLGAKEVVPFVIELMQPKSVIDIGCALGTWLAVFKQHGVEEILGVDGDFVDVNKLNIPPEYFLQHNLLNPLQVEQNFDLAVSLEVAEHLPIENAESFVDTLVNLSPAILFSAAVPYQPGTRHINCQWPNYWAKIFSEKGYVLFDCFRMKFWQNPNVPWWYAQNMFLFVKESCWQNYPILKQNFNPLNEPPLPIIHPEFYLKLQQQQGTSISQALSLLMKVTSKTINNKYFLKKSHHN